MHLRFQEWVYTKTAGLSLQVSCLPPSASSLTAFDHAKIRAGNWGDYGQESAYEQLADRAAHVETPLFLILSRETNGSGTSPTVGHIVFVFPCLSMADDWEIARLEGLVQPVWNYLAVSDAPGCADVIFVFGGRDREVPERAAELYHQGYAACLLVTGSLGRLTRGVFDKPEALMFEEYLLEAGVPPEAIITEFHAANTLENVRFGMAALTARGVSVSSALLVAKAFHMRRCVATFAKHFRDVRIEACPPAGGMRQALERGARVLTARLVGEVERLERYSKKGDIRRQEIPETVHAAIRQIKIELAVDRDA